VPELLILALVELGRLTQDLGDLGTNAIFLEYQRFVQHPG
jgi:hypothetical protein